MRCFLKVKAENSIIVIFNTSLGYKLEHVCNVTLPASLKHSKAVQLHLKEVPKNNNFESITCTAIYFSNCNK